MSYFLIISSLTTCTKRHPIRLRPSSSLIQIRWYNSRAPKFRSSPDQQQIRRTNSHIRRRSQIRPRKLTIVPIRYTNNVYLKEVPLPQGRGFRKLRGFHGGSGSSVRFPKRMRKPIVTVMPQFARDEFHMIDNLDDNGVIYENHLDNLHFEVGKHTVKDSIHIRTSKALNFS